MPVIPCPDSLRRLAERTEAPLYLVGGYVRNILLWGDTRGTDVDICGPLTVPQLTEALAGTAARVIPVNPRIGTVLVQVEGAGYEYTTWRQDSYPAGGVHTPTEVRFVRTVAEDAWRRDFRINALYADARTGEVLDPTGGGLADLAAGLVHTTRAARAVFDEDGLRILRLVRFCAQLGFRPHDEALTEAVRMRHYLADISPERRREEWQRINLADVRYGVECAERRGWQMLSDMGLWPYLLGVSPEGMRYRACPADERVRLAALVAEAARLTRMDPATLAERALGGEGIRYPNATVRDVVRLIKGSNELCTDREALRLWAVRYGADLPLVAPLLDDLTLAVKAAEALREVQEAHVPTHHKMLPLTPMQFEGLGVPRPMLGRAMQAVVDRCITELICPDAEWCTRVVLDMIKENQWN